MMATATAPMSAAMSAARRWESLPRALPGSMAPHFGQTLATSGTWRPHPGQSMTTLTQLTLAGVCAPFQVALVCLQRTVT